VGKVLGSIGSVAGGLSIGKEGPFVHAGDLVSTKGSGICHLSPSSLSRCMYRSTLDGWIIGVCVSYDIHESREWT
jgi:H+/Cl- antiporter ClcA